MRTYYLTPEELDEGNKLLSHFRGYGEIFEFHTSYQLLMECIDAIEKVETSDGQQFESIIGLGSSAVIVNRYKGRAQSLFESGRPYTIPMIGHEDKGYTESGTEIPVSKKIGIFVVCVKFAQWYNENWSNFY